MNFPQLLRLLLARFGGKLTGLGVAAGWLAVAALAVFFLFSMMLWVLPVVLALGAGIFLGRQKDLGTTLLRWRAALSALRHSWIKRSDSAVQDVRWRDIEVKPQVQQAQQAAEVRNADF
ncbi:MAG: hypothetical protein IJR28_06160 [Ottowia sp.]|nr:hypothetical protein [Ottowia sp.]